MTFMRLKNKRITALLLATAGIIALAGCSSGYDETLAEDLAAPSRVDMLAPPKSPDPSQMHPALQIARSRGLKTNVYFNEELQQAVARLQGMEETLGRLQSDLQGTAMAMQRVEMMRQEVEALNIKIQGIQERLVYAGPQLAPAPEHDAMAIDGEHIAADVQNNTPADITMADAQKAEADEVQAQISKPVMEDKPVKPTKAAAPAPTGKGVAGVRIGAHEGSVRIVLDINGAVPKFSADLDGQEKLLTVDLPKTVWSAPKSDKIANNPLVASYSAQPSDGGTVAAFVLKGDTKILETKTLKGEGGKPTRLIIDLSR